MCRVVKHTTQHMRMMWYWKLYFQKDSDEKKNTTRTYIRQKKKRDNSNNNNRLHCNRATAMELAECEIIFTLFFDLKFKFNRICLHYCCLFFPLFLLFLLFFCYFIVRTDQKCGHMKRMCCPQVWLDASRMPRQERNTRNKREERSLQQIGTATLSSKWWWSWSLLWSIASHRGCLNYQQIDFSSMMKLKKMCSTNNNATMSGLRGAEQEQERKFEYVEMLGSICLFFCAVSLFIFSSFSVYKWNVRCFIFYWCSFIFFCFFLYSLSPLFFVTVCL